ncbi:MAG: AAA family ATPase [Gammaproteobacteria bacterium]|nr:AAA family ATPase [Gammaproteobacteria bacterium]
MKRIIGLSLSEWQKSPYRKPLLLRGARQVGKTHSVRQLGKNFESYVEINFEKTPEAKTIFEGELSAKRLLRDIALFTGQPITPSKTLFFLDEIQEAPRAILALRYFYEELPELHIVGAGSLLEFAIEEIGVPVGRVEFLYMNPMSFIEYLHAKKHHMLIEEIRRHSIQEALNDALHNKFLNLFFEYLAIGGMPEAVQVWVKNNDIIQVGKIQQNLIDAYLQDIPKYSRKMQIKYVEAIFSSMPALVGTHFKYSRIHGEYRKRELAPALDLLVKAGLLHRVVHSSGNGIPLGAEIDEDKFKLIFLDVALTQVLLGLSPNVWLLQGIDTLVNRGEIVEAVIGQEILAYSEPHTKSKLFYWQREQANSQAEIDYLIQKNNEILPVEVKSNKGSTLKSMQLFLNSHVNSPYGVRVSTHNYSIHDKIHSYPLYAFAALVLTNDEVWDYMKE